MRKLLKIFLAASLLSATIATDLEAQDLKGRQVMRYVLDSQGDTVYIDNIRPARVFAYRKRKGQRGWRKYYRLVYNFNKVYPYTTVAQEILCDVDGTIAASNFTKKEKEAYMDGVQKELLATFEPIIRQMTISQGQLLCRLIDREIGITSYELVREYRGKASAWFWNGVAKLFDQNLKAHYDPTGVDAPTEELISAWEDGSFDDLYYSVFGKMPEHIVVPSKRR